MIKFTVYLQLLSVVKISLTDNCTYYIHVRRTVSFSPLSCLNLLLLQGEISDDDRTSTPLMDDSETHGIGSMWVHSYCYRNTSKLIIY